MTEGPRSPSRSYSAKRRDGMNNRALRDALEVTRGTTRRVRKVNSDRAHRIVTVRPDGWDSVDIVLPPSPECEATGAICTNAGARLEAGLATRIQGPPGPHSRRWGKSRRA